MVELANYQLAAIDRLKNGSILRGGVGSGKSRTALGYYLFKECLGKVKVNGDGGYREMLSPRDLYIITTAKKRDGHEWEKECSDYVLSSDRDSSHSGVKVTIDSWNNIKRYKDIYGAFFIFDEQRVVGRGAWVKTFLNIARKNHWILLSATPGDQWSDYIPVFVANGFYKNRTEFQNRHCVFNSYSKYPKIDRYVGIKQLESNRDSIMVEMDDVRKTERHILPVSCDYDREMYRTVVAKRWNPYDDIPIEECSSWYFLQRRVVNSDQSRIDRIEEISKIHERLIIFYNFNYELEMLRDFCMDKKIGWSEWNGDNHDGIPNGEQWIYLVQYSAGAEGWNCIETDTIIFFSQNYSYRITEQAMGRIDRMNTPFKDLYYYQLISTSPIDVAIRTKLLQKKNFNEDTSKWRNEK